MPVPSEHSAPVRGALQLVVLVAVTVLLPLGIRAVSARDADILPPSSFPLSEAPRARGPFEATPIEELAGMSPGVVVIGDSMAGSRVDHQRLSALTGLSVAPLFQAGSGSVWWYLALKNWVIPSGIRPRLVLIFFRDTNLTNVRFRLDEAFRWNVDRVATDHEPEVDAAIASTGGGALWTRVETGIEDVYGIRSARALVEPALSEWVGRIMIPSRRQRTAFMTDMNARFDFEHMRPMEAADFEATLDREADFHRYVDQSVLPLMLRDARRAGLTLCFVRVQRRPDGGQPPAQSPTLRRYIADLRGYIEANGGLWRDDTGDPAITSEKLYEDGDHLARHARAYYTEILYARLRTFFQ